jgi:hypothetical protein
VIDDDLQELASLEPDLLLQFCIFFLFVNLITSEFLHSEKMKGILDEAKIKSEKLDEDLAHDEMGIGTPTT